MANVSEREYFEALLKEHGKSHKQLAENVRTALAAQDKRLDGMNEFRAALTDSSARSITREIFEAESKDKQRQLDDLKRRFAILSGIGIVLIPFAGLIGAAVVKAFG